MIVAAQLAIAFFGLATGAYTAYKAYRVGEKIGSVSREERHELEKDYYLVSTVGWITLGSRLAAIPLFFLAVISLVPSVPGAMCEFGVFQAGYPYSWVDFALKFGTLYIFGGWLLLDYINKKCKEAPLIGTLARSFTLITPILFVDSFLDIMFFGSLQPIVVPCCRVVFPPEAIFSCPFCFVTYQMPLFLGVIPSYAIALFLVFSSIIIRNYQKRYEEVEKVGAPIIRNLLLAAIFLAIIGTLLGVIQLIIGPIGLRPS